MRSTAWFLLSIAVLGLAASWTHGATSATGDAPATPRASADAGSKPAAAPKPNQTPKPNVAKPAPTTDLSVAQERDVMGFVETHHPELAKLLKQLDKTNPAEYQHALRDLSRTVDRLGQVLEHNPNRYDTELARWKLQSRMQVLVARLSISDDPKVRERLRQTISQELDIERKLLVSDRAKHAAKLAEMDKRLKALEEDRQELIDARVDRLLKNVKKPTPKPKASESAKPSAAVSAKDQNKSKAEDK